MELLEWRDEFATGISGIDYEHEELIRSINLFYSKLTEHSKNDVLVDILNNIYGEIYSHFMLEERMMESHGYDQYEVHRLDHMRLLDEIRDITNGLERSEKYDEQDLRKKLNDWFAIHFSTHDARLHQLEDLIAAGNSGNSGLIYALKNTVSKIFGKKTDK